MRERLGFQLILYHGDAMLTVGLEMDGQGQSDQLGRAKNNPYLSQIDIFHFFSFYLKHTCEITCKKVS